MIGGCEAGSPQEHGLRLDLAEKFQAMRCGLISLPNSEVRNGATFGVLKLTLHPDGYEWQFVPIAGQTFTGAGSEPCH